MVKILLTGFKPFGKVTTNPSQLIVEHFAKQDNPELITEVLPVVYAKAKIRIQDLIRTHQPDAVLMLGVAQNREAISLERIAVNINDAEIHDNNGRRFKGDRIVEDAPVGYWSTLPLMEMYTQLKYANHPVSFSNHAGAYLCNHVFYIARHVLETSGQCDIPCGFIHLPAIETMPIDKQIQSIESCVQVLTSRLNVKDRSRLLKQEMERLSPKPRQAAILSHDGEILISCSLVDDIEMKRKPSLVTEKEKLASMSMASFSMGERISEQLGNGKFIRTIVYGTTGVFVLTYLNEEIVLATNFNTMPSIDELTKQLNGLSSGLIKLVKSIWGKAQTPNNIGG